jgi:hypothetical protein
MAVSGIVVSMMRFLRGGSYGVDAILDNAEAGGKRITTQFFSARLRSRFNNGTEARSDVKKARRTGLFHSGVACDVWL